MITKYAKLWIGSPQGAPPVIRLSQYDTDWKLVFTLYDGDALYTVPSEASVILNGLRPGGSVFSMAGTVEDGNVAVILKSSVTAEAGKVECEISISNSGEHLGTANFVFEVEKAPMSGHTASGDDFSAVNQLVNQALSAASSAGTASEAVAEIKGAVSSPLTAATAEAMTNHDKVYVYTGTTTEDLTNGHWYYYDGSDWQDGGVYNAVAVNTDKTLSVADSAADAKAAGDVASALLDLAAPTKYSEAIEWEEGRYNSSSGSKQASASGYPRYRTASKLPSSISAIKAPSGYTLSLYAWQGSTFIGSLRIDGTFKKVAESQGATAFADSIILKKYQVAYPAYAFALTIKHGSNEAVVENDLANVDFREDNISDIPDEIDGLEDGVNNAFETATGSRNLFWKPRSINNATGADYTPSGGDNTRYRTPFYLPEHVLRIVSSDLEFSVYAWDEEDGSYAGVLNNSGEVAPYTSGGPASKWLSVVDLESLRKSHPGYKWMLVTRNKADTSAEITQTQLDAAKAIIRINEIEEEFASVGIFERIGFAGASWECGYTWVDFDNDGTYEDSESFLAYSNSWPACMCRKNGNTCVNSSSSGASIKQWYEYSGNSPRGMKELISQEACDIYFLSLSGSNNSKSFTTSTVGTIADITGYNDYHDYPETFYGYYGKTVERLKAHAPNALIVIFSGPSGYDVHDTSTSAQVRKACEAATVEVAEHYGLPYIEIREDRFYDYYATHLSKSHPVPITYSGAARMYERLFSKAAVKYYDYFKYWPVERITVPEAES